MDKVRSYTAADRNACLSIFDSNVPTFFTAEERPGYERFLDERATHCAYLVIERGGAIVACGGAAVEDDGCTASLCWGMVENQLHRTGLGRALTKARLQAAAAMLGVSRVRLDTSQHTEGFYHRFGFVTERVIKDGYAPGLDRCDMRLGLPN